MSVARALCHQRAGWFTGLTFLVVLISGCATAPPLQVIDWPERQQHLAQIEQWNLSGRVAVKTDDDRSWNINLSWQQDLDKYDIQLSGPLGQGAMRLHGDALHVVMEVPDEPVARAHRAEELLEARLGWHVPVSGLQYWILGRPDPSGALSPEFDAGGRLVRLEQAGWTIAYKRYTSVNGVELPSKLELINHHLRVRLVIDRWELNV